MANERNSDCWYADVCLKDSCDACLRYLEMKFLMDSSGIPASRQKPPLLDAGVDYEQFCMLAKIKDEIQEHVEEGFNLYICSKETGNGKTTWSIKLLLKYFDNIWAGNGFRVRGMFIHIPTFLNQLKNFENPLPQEYREQVLSSDLVIWDDIASTQLSEYDHSQLLSYIDQRLLNRKANIFTGNSTNIRDLQNNVGVRLASRIWNTSQVVELRGKDRR